MITVANLEKLLISPDFLLDLGEVTKFERVSSKALRVMDRKALEGIFSSLTSSNRVKHPPSELGLHLKTFGLSISWYGPPITLINNNCYCLSTGTVTKPVGLKVVKSQSSYGFAGFCVFRYEERLPSSYSFAEHSNALRNNR